MIDSIAAIEAIIWKALTPAFVVIVAIIWKAPSSDRSVNATIAQLFLQQS